MMANYVPDTKRVFLADGDALNLDSEYMIKILNTSEKNLQILKEFHVMQCL